MSTSIAIMQEKGGVGKSTVTFNVAYGLAKTGKKVLVIDLDSQSSNVTYYFLGNTSRSGNEKLGTVMELFNEDASIDKVIMNAGENVDLIPANSKLINLSYLNKISRYKQIMAELKERYDYILTDVPPSPSWAHMLALTSDHVISVAMADPSSLQALTGLYVSIKEAKDSMNPRLNYLGILLNRYNNRTNLSKEVTEAINGLARKMETSVFDSSIKQAVVLSEQILEHQSIYDYAPRSNSAKEFESLVKEIVNRIEKVN